MFRRYYRFVFSGMALMVFALLMGACGGGSPSQPAAPTATPAPARAPGRSAQELQDRISESLNRTLGVEKQVLPSYHIEIQGSEPTWNTNTKRVETRTYTVKADVAGDNIHLTHTTATGNEAAKTIDGYIIAGGLAKSEAGGKEYEVVGGQLKDSFFGVGLAWAMLPLNLVVPLAVAATGPTPQGEEAMDGRTVEKYAVDSGNAPPGVMGILGGMFGVAASKGTVFVDRETGALLKATLDFEQNFVDPPGSGTVVGSGRGRIEIVVTRVGQVTVSLPK